MKIADVLAEVDELKPNQYDDSLKIQWISRLEGKIYNDVVMTHEMNLKKTDSSDDIESLIPADEDAEEETEETEEVEETEEGFGGYTEADINTTLIAEDTYADMYKYYVMAMIDFAAGETARYTNSMIMFNQAYSDYCHYINRTYMPKRNAMRF